jgi:SAM-dependent methyltransferase
VAAFFVRRVQRAYALGFRTLKKISPRDTMFRWNERQHYSAVGEPAGYCIAACLAAADKRDVRRILDFGCGYGRVLRVLRKEFPDATIVASDLDRGGVDFCSATFGARGVYSNPDPARIRFDERFELIWIGSVFTHIDRASWQGLLPALRRALSDDGVLIITTQGPEAAEKVRTGQLLLRAANVDGPSGESTATTSVASLARRNRCASLATPTGV